MNHLTTAACPAQGSLTLRHLTISDGPANTPGVQTYLLCSYIDLDSGGGLNCNYQIDGSPAGANSRNGLNDPTCSPTSFARTDGEACYSSCPTLTNANWTLVSDDPTQTYSFYDLYEAYDTSCRYLSPDQVSLRAREPV